MLGVGLSFERMVPRYTRGPTRLVAPQIYRPRCTPSGKLESGSRRRASSSRRYASNATAGRRASNCIVQQSPHNFVRKIRTSLGRLGRSNEVLLQWASSYSNVPGIAQAENLTLLAQSEAFAERDAPSPSWWMIKQQVSSSMRQQWTTRWQQRADCRQTKIWFPEPHMGKTAELLGKSRLEVSSLVQCITGHNFLRKHEALIDSGESLDSCRYCEEDSVPESSFHVVGECRAFNEVRHAIFQAPYVGGSSRMDRT